MRKVHPVYSPLDKSFSFSNVEGVPHNPYSWLPYARKWSREKKRQDSGNEVVEERSRSGKVKAFYFEPGKIDVLKESLEIFKL